jgi:hypothetical protein
LDIYRKLLSEFEGLKFSSDQTVILEKETEKINNIIIEKLTLLEEAVNENDQNSIRELSVTIRILIDGLKTML